MVTGSADKGYCYMLFSADLCFAFYFLIDMANADHIGINTKNTFLWNLTTYMCCKKVHLVIHTLCLLGSTKHQSM